MFIGLRLRTILAITLVLTSVGTAYGYFFHVRASTMAQKALRSNLEATLGAFAIPCAMAIAANRIDQLDNLVANVSSQGEALGLLEITVVDHTGRVLADSNVERFGQVLTDGFTQAAMRARQPIWSADGSRAFSSHPVTSGLRWGTLRATLTLEPLQQQLAQRRTELIALMVVTTVFLILSMIIVLGVLVVNPVRRLAQVVQQLGSGEREARVRRYRRDEIGELSRTFDEMAAQISRHTDELEHKVEQRTAELAESNQQLSTTNEALAKANRQLERLAVTDGLTGLFNHRHFQEVLSHEVRRADRAAHRLSVVMIDVDHFKHYNDTHGHPAGDELLRELSFLLASNLRATDIVARYGGEEFVLLLMDCDRPSGLATAEKLRALVEAHPFEHSDEQPLGRLTISVGVAFYPDDSGSPGDLIFAADQALYRSKRAGRNRVTGTEVTP